MAGVTDLPFRKLCIANGAAAAVSEMLASNPLLWHTKKSQKRMDHSNEAGLRWVQIAGSEPEQMAQAAQYNAKMGAHIIDINMGCPAKKVCKKAAGSALLSDPKKVRKILQRVVDAVNIPVTLKIRTGSEPNSRNALEIAQIAEETGIQALTIHGRTRACKFSGEAEFQTIAEVKKAINIPVIANGDINSVLKAKTILDFTAADGIMIGRAAQGQPWLFNQIRHYLATGKCYPQPGMAEITQILLDHVIALHQFYGIHMGVKIARKHVGWYLENLQAGKAFRKDFNQIDGAVMQLNWIQQLATKFSLEQPKQTMKQIKQPITQSFKLAKVS